MSLVVFDLDGTLLDSAPGILASLRAALADLGLPPIDTETQRSFLGPPLHTSFRRLVGPDLADAAVAAYRRHYGAGGLFVATVYDGVAQLLEELTARGEQVAVATSKAEFFARQICDHFGLTRYVATVCGDTLDYGRPTKADVLGEVVRRIGRQRHTVMVGDRALDVEGARAHGLACLGAGWGYGLPGELAGAGAAGIFESPADLGAALLDGIDRASA